MEYRTLPNEIGHQLVKSGVSRKQAADALTYIVSPQKLLKVFPLPQLPLSTIFRVSRFRPVLE